MKPPAGKLKQLLTELGGVMRREAVALQSLALRDVPDILARKRELIQQFENLESSMEIGQRISIDLYSEIEGLRRQAAANAEKLMSIAEGASRAQKRLQALQQKDLHAGAYTASGQERRFQSSGFIGAKV